MVEDVLSHALKSLVLNSVMLILIFKKQKLECIGVIEFHYFYLGPGLLRGTLKLKNLRTLNSFKSLKATEKYFKRTKNGKVQLIEF